MKYKNLPNNPVTLNKPTGIIVYMIPRNPNAKSPIYNYYNRNTLIEMNGINPLTRQPINMRKAKRVRVTNRPKSVKKKRAVETVRKYVKTIQHRKKMNKILNTNNNFNNSNLSETERNYNNNIDLYRWR